MTMQLLDQIIVNRAGGDTAAIQLLQGDLSAIPAEHAADILVISAYPGSYVPVPGTLIAALENKGLDISNLAKHKAIDLSDQLGCWLSAPLEPAQQQQLNIKKILCFEPWQQSGDQATVVGNLFRCINTFAFNSENNVIAMPVLASGQQNVALEKMLPALLDASIFWLENGLPLHFIKLVLHGDNQVASALPVFKRAKEQNELRWNVQKGSISANDALKILEANKKEQLPGEENLEIVGSQISDMAVTAKKKPLPKGAKSFDVSGISAGPEIPTDAVPKAPAQTAPPVPQTEQTSAVKNDDYDYFISYAHTHADLIQTFVEKMTATRGTLKIFYDKSSIPAGGLWIKQISDAIQKAKKVLIFLSPDYSNSPVCWDEFQCAKLVEYNKKTSLIQTIYLFNDISMPPIMGIYSWADGREGSKEKLQAIAESLLKEVAS